ncbi:Golgi transport complex subunit 6, partial [Clydaea vesicula]
MGLYEENAYVILFKWNQSEFKSFNREIIEVSPILRESLKALKNRPALYESCIEEISQIRKTTLLRAFIDALTRGGPGGTPKPIEMHAHDPLRYIGDMLAWLHQAAANEREVLESLMDIKMESSRKMSVEIDPVDIESTTVTSNEALENPENNFFHTESLIKLTDKETLMQVLDKNLEGTIRPLKVRVEQILSASPGAIQSYKISNVIHFYDSTIKKVLGKRSQLSLALTELNDISNRVFFDTLNTQAKILSSYDSSLLPTEKKEKEVEKVLTATLDPLLQMCVESSAKLASIESATYMVNCLHYIHMALVLYPYTQRHVNVIELQIESQIEVLTDEMYQFILRQSKLSPFIQAIENNHDKQPLSLLPETNYKVISEAMAWLDVYLGSLGPDDTSSAVTRLLSSTRLARQVLRGGYLKFLGAYKLVYQQVMDPANKYEFPA